MGRYKKLSKRVKALEEKLEEMCQPIDLIGFHYDPPEEDDDEDPNPPEGPEASSKPGDNRKAPN